jgi:hypothetical protein
MRAVVIAIAVASTGTIPAERACASPEVATVPADRLERWWTSVSNPPPRFGTRDFFAYALEAAAAGQPAERIETALAHAARKQDRTPTSPTYGNFAWYWEDEKPVDRNCVEFSMQRATLLWMYFQERLSPRARELLLTIFRYAAEGIRRHRVSPSYTNIYLKKAWNCIALGESVGIPDLAEEGRRMLHTWLAHTWTNGVSEYLSPTYYAIDLENLGLIARHSRDPATREAARTGMDFLWTEIAAHWFDPAGRLGGPHSRDYDYLRGVGDLNRWTAHAGWPSAEPDAERSWFRQACWVPPPAAASALRERTPRMVRGRWSSQPGHTIAQWVGRRIALGTVGAAYPDSMDKVAVVLFPGMKRPTLSFLMDARLDPYGKNRYVTHGGHLKAFHVFPFLASVQRGPYALWVASTANSNAFRLSGTNLSCLISHWVLPADLPLWIGECPTPVGKDPQITLPSPNTAVFARDGDAAMAVRFLWGTGDPASVELVRDGLAWNAQRLSWVHSRQPPRGIHAVAVEVRVAEGLTDETFREFRERFLRHTPKVTVQGSRITLESADETHSIRLVADYERGERIQLEGAEPWATDALLAIDGTEIGRPILQRVLRAPASAPPEASGPR